MEIKSVAQSVVEQPFFAGLDDRFHALVGGCARNARFRAGEYLFRERQSADLFYLLRRGRVALEVTAPGRGALRVATLGEGEIVGVSWLAPPHRWTCDARALEDVRAISLDGACLRRKCDADHDLGYEMMQRFMPIVIQRLQATRRQTLRGDGQP